MSYDIREKLDKWEEITKEEKDILNRVIKYEEEERKNLEEREEFFKENPDILKKIEEHKDRHMKTLEDLEEDLEKLANSKELQNKMMEKANEFYKEREIYLFLKDELNLIEELNNNIRNDNLLRILKNKKITKNRQNAVDYALKWSSNEKELRNIEKYKSFSNDCANFISQILEAWWIKQIKNFNKWDKKDNRNWFFEFWRWWWYLNSRSWTVSEDLKNHFVENNNYEEINNFSEMEIWDVIFFDWGWLNWDAIDHAVVVTEINEPNYNWVKISAHTTDRNNITFWDFMKKARSMKNVRYVDYQIWRVKYK